MFSSVACIPSGVGWQLPGSAGRPPTVWPLVQSLVFTKHTRLSRHLWLKRRSTSSGCLFIGLVWQPKRPRGPAASRKRAAVYILALNAMLLRRQADKTRVKDYIHRLDNFDGPAVGEIAVGYEMFEEAFEIYRKFGLKTQAIRVLLDHQEDLGRALEYALKVGLPLGRRCAAAYEKWIEGSAGRVAASLAFDSADVWMSGC